MIATCCNAVLFTLPLQALFNQRVGILTVNLGTIVFIIVLSHLVYMTFNWQTLARRGRGKESSELAMSAFRMTLPASFWSMICSSLGFGSLLLVEAKPLRQLGFGGVLGTGTKAPDPCARLGQDPHARPSRRDQHRMARRIPDSYRAESLRAVENRMQSLGHSPSTCWRACRAKFISSRSSRTEFERSVRGSPFRPPTRSVFESPASCLTALRPATTFPAFLRSSEILLKCRLARRGTRATVPWPGNTV